jgi:hypothetical protein
MKKGNLKLRIPNPHKNEIDKSLLREIVKQANIERLDWDSIK